MQFKKPRYRRLADGVPNMIGACLLLAVVWSGASEAVPHEVPFQGKIIGADGEPITGDEHILQFSICDESGSLLWGPQVFDLDVSAEPQQGHRQKVSVMAGRFAVVLGEEDTSGKSILQAFEGADVFLRITVNGTELSQREKLLSTPYALLSARSVPVGAIIPWVAIDPLTKERVKTLARARELLPAQFAICVGEDDPLTEYDEGLLPNLQDQRFLRAAAFDAGESEFAGLRPTVLSALGSTAHRHSATITVTGSSSNNFLRQWFNSYQAAAREHGHRDGSTNTSWDSHVPEHIPVLYVMRIK